MKILKRLLLILLVLAVAAAALYAWKNRPIPDFGRQVLVFTKTTGFRHDVIPAGVKAVTELGRREQFNVVHTEDASEFTDSTLSQYQAVVFLNTTGDVLDSEQQVSFERYIQAGGGYVGIHSAADTEWRDDPWHWYQRLVGGVFVSHPKNSDQPAELSVVGEHSTTANLPKQWSASDEWYDYQRLSSGANVLLTVSEDTYEGGQMGDVHPVAWYRDFDGGRSFYVGLGHTESTYKNDHFLALLHGGLEYAMGDGAALDYAKSRPEAWRFTRTILDSGLNEPLKIAFSPAGELYYVQRRGALMRYNFTSEVSEKVAQLDVFSEQEYGLIGLAFDPAFEQNNWLYLFRTLPRGDTAKNVLSRFQLTDGKLRQDTEQELLTINVDGNAELRATHTGGDMQFDDQGVLWITTGDDTQPGDQSQTDDRPGQIFRDAARSSGNTQDLRGKILRIKPNADKGYSIPEGNLFTDASKGRPEIYIMGLRNPYTLAFDERSGYVYWGDVGPDGKAPTERGPMGYDEVNRAGAAGNYGWPFVVADNRPYAYYDYENEKPLNFADVKAPENPSRNNTGARILPPAQPAWLYYPYDESKQFWELGTGGRNALVAPLYYAEDYDDSEFKFPAYLDGKLIISDFVRRWLKVVNTDASGAIESFIPLIEIPLSAPLDMAYGPDGALYILEYGTDWFAANDDAYLSRIEFYAGDNPPPVALASAGKLAGAAPLETVLDASASYDRGAGPVVLQYRWQIIENGKPGKVIGTQKKQPIRLETEGVQWIQLTVTDAGGIESSTKLQFRVGNERPSVRLNVDGNRSFFFENQPLNYAVEVDDLEDGSTQAGTIAGAQVSVLFDYIGQSEDLAKALSSRTSDAVLEGRRLVTEGSDCHACHGIDSASVGPSFKAIAERYAGREDATEYLTNVISAGGSGQWDGGHAMPAHPDLSEQALRYTVRFIASLASEQSETAGGMPLTGEVNFAGHQDDAVRAIIEDMVTVDLGDFYPGTYVLHASYTDKGTDTAVALQGSDTLLLRHPRVSASAFADEVGVLLFSVNDAVRLAIYRYPGEDFPEVNATLKDVDLTGIRAIKVVATAMKPIMSGGTLELRLGSADAPATASIDIEASFSTDLENSQYEIDVSKLDGVHNLIFASGESEKSGQVAFAIMYMEFLR
ncbi:MAG: ThuA domain-containing protein [Halioglobus sp.]